MGRWSQRQWVPRGGACSGLGEEYASVPSSSHTQACVRHAPWSHLRALQPPRRLNEPDPKKGLQPGFTH